MSLLLSTPMFLGQLTYSHLACVTAAREAAVTQANSHCAREHGHSLSVYQEIEKKVCFPELTYTS